MQKDSEQIILSRIGLLKCFGFHVAKTQVELLKDGTKVYSFRKVVIHFADHRHHVVIHIKPHVLVDIAKAFDDTLGKVQIPLLLFANTKVFQ